LYTNYLIWITGTPAEQGYEIDDPEQVIARSLKFKKFLIPDLLKVLDQRPRRDLNQVELIGG
jgi:hypothetical protein